MILSISSTPLYPLKAFGTFLALLFNVKLSAWYNVWSIKVDLPLPETPVTHVKLPTGILRLTLFKLLPLAPLISTNLPFVANLLVLGISINLLCDKYCPVIIFLFFKISL